MAVGLALGEVVREAASAARRQALLCAPFTKAAALEGVLGAIDTNVEVELFTRWRPDEVAAGVSDTAVLPLIEERGGSVHLCEPLHAKLFRFDERALIGSANLTASALGWSARPNVELLVEVPASTSEVLDLEEALRQQSVRATPEIAAAVEHAAALLPSTGVEEHSQPFDFPPATAWHPLLRDPSDLFAAYSRGALTLSSASASAAATDLLALEPPPGLDRQALEALVATRLLQLPLIQEVDELLAESQRFGAVRDLLAETLSMSAANADYAWQTLMRWLLYFLPDRYARTVPSHSEVMVRRDRPSP